MYWAPRSGLRPIAAHQRLYAILELSRLSGNLLRRSAHPISLRRPAIGNVGKPAINGSASTKLTCCGQTPELPRLQALMALFIEDKNCRLLPNGRGASLIGSFWAARSGQSSF
jgi:hypothetical protein